MAVTRKPTDYLPNYSANSTTLTLTLADLDGVTSAEANASSGDIFEVLRGILSALQAAYAAKDRSENMSLDKSAYVNSAGHIVQTFTATFDLTAGSLNVTAEPAA